MRRVLILFFVVITLFACACSQDEPISLNNDSVYVSSQQSSVISITEINGTEEGVFEIARALPPLAVFEDGCFYAYNRSGVLFRIKYDGDMEILSESLEVYVRYTDIKKISYSEPLLNSWMPDYEVTAEYVGLVARPY